MHACFRNIFIFFTGKLTRLNKDFKVRFSHCLLNLYHENTMNFFFHGILKTKLVSWVFNGLFYQQERTLENPIKMPLNLNNF